MIYLLVDTLEGWLESVGLGFLRVFRFAEFQALVAVVMSFSIVMLLGPTTIRWLQRKKIGDRPDFDEAALNALMNSKAGTPTMGGLLIIAAIAGTTLVLANVAHNFYVQMAMVCLLWLGGVGAIDDWLKLTRKDPKSRQGLHSGEKLLFQVGLAILLCVFTYNYGQNIPNRNFLYLPFFKDIAFELGLISFSIIGVCVLVGSSNAVNLTDGLDGLAAGCMSIASFAFLLLSLIVGVPRVADFLLIPYIQGADQMAVIAGAMVGACLGFLWFNCNPAKVFMGDTGSLALGGLLGYIAIVIRQELILIFIGGIFVAEAMSVMLQVSYFKYTRKRFGEGRRIFLMSPLHHHFQKMGWTETQVVTRFWLIGALLAVMALATIKLR